MDRLLKKVSLAITAMLLVVWSAPCHAAESTFKGIFTDSVYGGLTGTLVGTAVMAFTKKPGDHLEYIGYGAAAGVIAGAAFGIGKALVEMENGKVRLSLPAIVPDFQETNSRKQAPVLVTTQLLRGRF